MERQHYIFIAGAGGAFAVLVLLAFYNPFQQILGDDNKVIEATRGEQVVIRYSSNVVSLIQGLPDRNTVEVEMSSELQLVNLAGLRGEVRYSDMEIQWVEDGEVKTINDNDFKTISYAFFPDTGNKTSYNYEDVEYVAKAEDAMLIVAIKPISTAKVGEEYTLRMVLHTGGLVGYEIAEKTIKIVG